MCVCVMRERTVLVCVLCVVAERAQLKLARRGSCGGCNIAMDVIWWEFGVLLWPFLFTQAESCEGEERRSVVGVNVEEVKVRSLLDVDEHTHRLIQPTCRITLRTFAMLWQFPANPLTQHCLVFCTFLITDSGK